MNYYSSLNYIFHNLHELRYVLTCIGDKMDEKDAEEMLKQLDGMVDYRRFVDLLIPDSK